MISWETCKEDFRWDGSWRDIYITPASLEDWKAIFPYLRSQSNVKFSSESGTGPVPEVIDESFFGHSRPALQFRVSGILVAFHFFTPDEIECDIDPREITGQASLNALLGFLQQLGDLTHKRAVLTPENLASEPILSYEPKIKSFQYHEAAR